MIDWIDFELDQEEENQRRRERDLPPVPPPDLSRHPLFRPIPTPDVLSELLSAQQISQNSEDLINTSTQAFDKLYALDALEKQLK